MRSRPASALAMAVALILGSAASGQQPEGAAPGRRPGGAPPAPMTPVVGEAAAAGPRGEPREGGEGGEGGEREGRREIETDRDSFTPATTTAGKGRLIFESAYSFIDNRGVKETHSFPELLFRYGLTERLELRLGWNYEVGGAGSDVSGSGSAEDVDFFSPGRLERETNLSYGLKYLLSEQRRWLPGSSVILQGSTPTSGEGNDTQFTGTYVFGWELPNRWKLDGALRYGTGSEKEDRFNIWAPSAVLKVPVGERVNVHAEYFGLFSQGKEGEFVRHFVSPGAHYLITDDLEVGVRVGWGLNGQSARFFVNAGLGWRF